MVFLASNPIYDAIRAQSRRSKWSSFIKDVEKFVCPYHDLEVIILAIILMLLNDLFTDYFLNKLRVGTKLCKAFVVVRQNRLVEIILFFCINKLNAEICFEMKCI